jgi:flagellar assembly factor FliW
MQSLEPNAVKEGLILQTNKSILFPEGLPAFEEVREFVLISNEEEQPFLWLQAADSPNLAFIAVDPFLINPDYKPDICDDDVNYLHLSNPREAMVLSIVNIHNSDENGITANLVGPIIINVNQRIGKQVILQNHLNYSVRYPIPST